MEKNYHVYFNHIRKEERGYQAYKERTTRICKLLRSNEERIRGCKVEHV